MVVGKLTTTSSKAIYQKEFNRHFSLHFEMESYQRWVFLNWVWHRRQSPEVSTVAYLQSHTVRKNSILSVALREKKTKHRFYGCFHHESWIETLDMNWRNLSLLISKWRFYLFKNSNWKFSPLSIFTFDPSLMAFCSKSVKVWPKHSSLQHEMNNTWK